MYEYALIELNKLKAPSMLIEDYVYLLNKAIQQYINLIYNRAEYNQQSSDDLAFLQTSDEIEVSGNCRYTTNEKIWDLELPKDYIHMLNCIATFTRCNSDDSKRCSNLEDKSEVSSLCRRLTADIYPDTLRNYYLRPSYKNPYWYIINKNTDGERVDINTNSYKDNGGNYIYLKDRGDRTAHQSTVKVEIHSDRSDWDLSKIYITYIKAPMYVSMTEEDVLKFEDDTQVLEFPDYICYEIINLFVKLVMENISDPRLQTNIPVNQTISVPGK